MKKFLFVIVTSINLFMLGLAVANSDSLDKKTLCVACHGENGVTANPEWPNLAGQHANYMIKQLKDYRGKTTRQALIMSGVVANLSDTEMTSLAAWYAAQPLPKRLVTKKNLTRGEQLYRVGDFKKHVPACIACHGPNGLGNEEAGFPLLKGQHANYIIQQLQAFKEKTRKNDLNAIMRDISARMSQHDIKDVADYIEAMH